MVVSEETQYPHLYKAVQRSFCTTATSAPSERVFSLASRVITMNRSRLKEDITRPLVMLKENGKLIKEMWHIIDDNHVDRPFPGGTEVEEHDINEEDFGADEIDAEVANLFPNHRG